MMTQDQIIELFDLLCKPSMGVGIPTDDSVRIINSELGIQLPPSLIEFAKVCPGYGSWFAGLGEDYSNHLHIIQLNKMFHRKNADGSGLPDWAIIVNHGHDGDCDCLDARHYDATSGEYPLIYWDWEADELFVPQTIAATFMLYMETLVLGWAQGHFDNKNRTGQVRHGSRDIVSRIEALLNRIDPK